MNKQTSLLNLAVLISAVIFIIDGCTSNSDNQELREIKKHNAQATDLKPVSSEQELLNYLRNGVIVNATEQPSYATQMEFDSVADTASSAESGSYSETNLQVSGVDESDIVKYNGSHLFIASNPNHHYYWSMLEDGSADNAPDEDYAKVRIMETSHSPPSSEEINQYQLSSPGIDIHGLYHDQNESSSTLIAVTKTFSSYYTFDVWYEPGYWSDGRAGIHLIDVSEPESPAEIFSLEIEGTLVDTRKIDDKVYLVTRYSPMIDGLIYQPATKSEKLANQNVVDSLPLGSFLPRFTVNGETVDNLLEATDCYIPDNTQDDEGYATLITLTTVDISTNSINSQCISGYTDGIFASTTGVYLFASAEQETAIHKMSYADDGVEYLDTGYVQGNLGWRNPAFRLGEHNNVLSVLSSYFETDANTSLKHLLTLFSSPTQIGEVFEPLGVLPNETQPEDIGKPGEDIFAVRYVGTRGYAVTFEQIDPLYVFDLSDPAAPKIAGELEVPGVSQQLHPIGEDYLVGIGYDFDENAQFFGGVKVELFNVSDMSNPQSIDQIVFGGAGSYSAAVDNHHGFSFLSIDEDNHRLTLPVQLNDTLPEGVDPNATRVWYNWTNTGLRFLEIETGASQGLSLVGAMITATNEEQNYPEYDWNTRSVIHGDSVYYSGSGKVWSASWDFPELIDGPK